MACVTHAHKFAKLTGLSGRIMEHPKISVIIPIYNASDYLAEAIDSILQQTFTQFELLLCDDRSSDNSTSIAQAYADQDERVIFLQNERNMGVSATRNRLQQLAKGEYTAVMDADDIAHPNRFQVQYDFMQANPHVVCCGSNHRLIDDKGRVITTLALPEVDEEIQSRALAGHGSICHPAAMIRSEAILQVGGYDPDFKSALDLDMWLKLGEVGELYNIQQTLLDYRIHDKSISGSKSQQQRDNARKACERAWARRNIQGHFEASDMWRPQSDKDSRLHFMLKYGWWSLGEESPEAAVHYSWEALKLSPFKLECWKLFLLSLKLNGKLNKTRVKHLPE